MQTYYIFVDATNVIRGIQSASGPIEAPGYIECSEPLDPNLLGRKFLGLDDAGMPLTEEVPMPGPQDDERYWWIDVGPFYTRFGMDAVAIAASDAGPCKAVDKLCAVRKFINLKDPTVAQMIDMLIATQQPTAVAYAPGSGPMTAEKKAAILNTPTTDYERHIKGLPDATPE